MDLHLTELVRYLAAQSWQVAVLTLVVAGATWALRHRTAHIRYLLWLIILAKCLVPPFFAVPLRVLPEKTAPHASTETPPAEPARVKPESTPTASIPPSPPPAVVEPGRVEQVNPPRVENRPSRPLDLPLYAGIAWIAGAGLYLAMNLLRALRGRYWLAARRRPLPDEIRNETETLLSTPDGRPGPPVWVIDEIGQPFVWGLLRGSIYLPSHFLKIGDRAHRRQVLAHELSHVLRFDAAVNALQTLAQGLFWFHPFVWWANREIRREREKCCDEMAVAQLGTEAREYCHAVVETLASAETSARPAPSLAVAGPARNLEERIKTMLRPGRQFYRRPSGPTALVVLLAAILTVPTAVVLTVRARTEGRTEEEKAMLSNAIRAYEASRNAAPRTYLLVVKNDFDVYVTYQSAEQLHRAKYTFGSPKLGQSMDIQAVASDRTDAGETIRSILAWAGQHTPQNVEVHDGMYTCSLWPNGYGYFEGGQKTTARPSEMFLPTLRGLGWPLLGGVRSTLRLISTDRYASDHNLICIEEQHEAIRDGREKVTLTTRFYLNPERDYLCQRRLEPHNDYAEEITEYGQIDGAKWYPLEISEFGYRHMRAPMTSEPSRINTIYLDLDPTFPDDIFSPDALLARYADRLVPPQQEIPSSGMEAEDDSAVRVAGRVLDGATRKPIAGALVRVAAPAMDMRDARVPVKNAIYETRTNADGIFEFSVPVTDEIDDISVDALAPGYNTAAGTFRGGADDPTLGNLPLDRSWRSLRSNLTILLSPGLYVAGTVSDEQGRPASGVTVFATLRAERSSGGIARTMTDAQGRFEIFDFPLKKQADERAVLSFTSAPTLQENVTGLYDMTEEQRRSLKVTMHSGRKITGLVQNAVGRPAADVAVEAVIARILVIRETTTDRSGRFELAGLPMGPLDVRAYDFANDQKAMLAIMDDKADQPVTVRMQSIKLAHPVEPVTMLGMQVVDVTKELQEAYDVHDSEGVMIWDPGTERERLDIGELKKGYCIWMIEDKRIADLRALVTEILRAQLTPWQDGEARFRDPPARVRVVYSTRGSNNTQHLKLTAADVAELSQLAARLGITVASESR